MAAKTPKNKSKANLISNNTQSSVPYAIVEAYKSLRVHLTSILSKIDGKVIAISSPNASEGKSTTSVNIAIMLSQLNKKVLLIDTDSRRGTIHQKLKLENKVGCLDVLLDEVELDKALQSYSQFLDVLTTGKPSGNSSELFDSPAFERLISEVKNNYDYIIVDTPPINLVSDSLVISQKCDGVLLIVRCAVTTYEAFKQTHTSLEHLNINLIGVVLNGVGANINKYYKYKKYYGYSKYNKYGYNGYRNSK